ncbi:hypothetical protein EDD80_108125 [Anseongella ginsenosidimutans]|uniref:TonB-dependent receptor-like protein n=1 Tax=Anseongella ginsenosidimutans TaxID=496056 RepID=A0A4R3KPM8_9SPHI|nr:TonB-dependent receptor [Anseongella ginsenosidimutans]QEC53945.1 TonB-dependent receptor [Anseongella ginsenosidimutans]TCS86332.1 hypothetical protein EDD80_108125 [Anseongella ginsenosidimutans]
MTSLKTHLLISLAGIFLHFTAAAQEAGLPPSLEQVNTALSSWLQDHPQEKVYLHTDKPYYAIGDTIWFKAYVVLGPRHQLSALSGAVHVELIDETGSIAEALKLPLVAGTAKGDFALSSEYKEGNYRLRAYTQWMRNAGPDYFYDFTFPVGNAVSQSLNGGISYEYAQEGGENVLLATLNLQEAPGGKPLAGSKVEYIFRKGLEDHIGRGETDASGKLQFPVPEDFRSGSYLLIRLEDADGRVITKTFPLDQGSGTDVQFFPEGGELVNGLPSRVAFKATGPGGQGVPISGFVFNSKGDTLSELRTKHAGMGFFTLTPAAGEQYHAAVNYPDGSKKDLPLPKALENGYVLWAYPYLDSDTLLLRIMAAESGYGNINLLIHHEGEVLNAAPLNITRPLSSLRIPCGDFPSGITTITLFDEQNRPLCERVVFIRRDDSLRLALSAGGPVHGSREKTAVGITASDENGKPVSGTFSVAVIDENKVPLEGISENTIFSGLLLRSALKGYIEDPAYYFRDNSRETAEHLDLLLMTQGYRRFTWKELLDGPLPAPAFAAEELLTPIGGKLLTLGGKPVEGGTITLLSLSGMIMRDTVSNAKGEFSFGTVLLGKDVSFTVQGRNAKGGKNVEVIMDSIPGREPVNPNPNRGDLRNRIGADIKTYLANSRAQLEDLEKHGMTERVNMLQGVTVTAKSSNSGSSPFAIPEGHSDQTLRLTDPGLCSTLLLCLQGRLHGVTFQSTGTTMAPYSRGERMSVFLNGRLITNETELADILENNGVAPADVERVDVVRSNVALMALFSDPSASSNGGALLITTRSGSTRPAPYSPEIVHYTPRGFDVSREFYSPRYDAPRSSLLADLRSTIYWNPSLITGKDGKTSFDFFNADQPGVYRMVIEGIGGNGQLGRKVLRYKVE